MPLSRHANGRPFQSGDLVYGAEKFDWGKSRSWYIDNAAGPFRKQNDDDNAVRRIDEFAVLNHEKGKVDSSSLKQALTDHPKYGTSVDGQDTNENVRRKSKGGLYWATMVENKYVHFVLDGINMRAVVEKNNVVGNRDYPADDEEDEPKNRSITGSELRWIFRSKSNAEVQERVQFWLGGMPCAAPWLMLPESDEGGYPAFDQLTGKAKWGSDDESKKRAEALWSTYKPKSEQVDHAASGATSSPSSAASAASNLSPANSNAGALHCEQIK